jgi:hypothetical protein
LGVRWEFSFGSRQPAWRTGSDRPRSAIR